MRTRPIRLLLALAGCAASLLAPAAADAITPADALAMLNLQRTASGIPGDVVEAPELTDGCAKHATYIGLNGGMLASGEDPAKPGFTPEGDRQTLDSAGVELLSGAATWSQTSSPWLAQPIHLFRMFDPEVVAAGYSDTGAIACLRLRGGRAPATAPALYSVPASGATGVPTSELDRETPYTPQQLAGIPTGQATGPNILLFTRGLRGSQPLSAPAFSLTGPRGAVDARLVTEATTSPVGSGSWFRGGGVLIAVAPLAPFATYVAHVTWHRDAEDPLPAADAEQVVSFETAGLPNPLALGVVTRGDVNDIHVTTPAPNPTVKLIGPGRLTDIESVHGGVARYAALAPGTWTACARSGGRAVGYVPATVCAPFTASAQVGLSLATERARAWVLLHVARVAEGRPAQVTVARYRLVCERRDGRRRCTRQTVGHATRAAVILRAPRMRLKLPRPQSGVRLSARVVLGAFTVGDAPYLAADIRRAWG